MISMIAEASPRSARVWLPPALLALFAVLLQLCGPDLVDALRYDRIAVDQGQWWRLVTANFVHLGGWHLFLNVLSLALLVALCPDRLSPMEWLRRVLLIGLGMSLGLHWFVPGLATYVGLSGLIYGLFALGLGRQALAGDRIAIASVVFLACRIIWELTIGAPESEQQLIGGGVVAESHLSGVVSALLYGLVFGGLRPDALSPDNEKHSAKTE